MTVRSSKQFPRDLRGKTPTHVVRRAEAVIAELMTATDLRGISQLKLLVGHPGCFRIRIGDYRLGLKLIQSDLWLMRLLHRSEIYRYFP